MITVASTKRSKTSPLLWVGGPTRNQIPLARAFLGVFLVGIGSTTWNNGPGFSRVTVVVILGWVWMKNNWGSIHGFKYDPTWSSSWRSLDILTELSKRSFNHPKKVTKNWQGESVLGLCCLRGHHHLFLTVWWLMRFHICCWDKRKDMTQVSTIQYLCNPPKL